MSGTHRNRSPGTRRSLTRRGKLIADMPVHEFVAQASTGTVDKWTIELYPPGLMSRLGIEKDTHKRGFDYDPGSTNAKRCPSAVTS